MRESGGEEEEGNGAADGQLADGRYMHGRSAFNAFHSAVWTAGLLVCNWKGRVDGSNQLANNLAACATVRSEHGKPF